MWEAVVFWSLESQEEQFLQEKTAESVPLIYRTEFFYLSGFMQLEKIDRDHDLADLEEIER